MDPLERKSLFILMSFQVNRRDFCLVSVESLEQDRSILSLIPVTIKAVYLGLTFYWNMLFPLWKHVLFVSIPDWRREAQCDPRGIPLSRRHSRVSEGKAWLVDAAYASYHQNGNLLDQ